MARLDPTGGSEKLKGHKDWWNSLWNALRMRKRCERKMGISGPQRSNKERLSRRRIVWATAAGRSSGRT